MAKDPADVSRSQHRFDAYQRHATTPLLINGFVFLGSFIAVLTDRDEPFGPFLLKVTWLVFVIDYVIMFALAPHRLTWAVTHLHYLVALIFPPLRIVLLLILADRVMRNRNSPLREKVGLTMIYATTLIVVFGAYFVWQLERDHPGANIETYGESLWWAVATVTTVGYGDYVPVTTPGRIVGTVMLFNGIAAIAVLSGVIVSYFLGDGRKLRRAAQAPDGPPAAVQEPPADASTAATLLLIEQRLATIESAVGIGHGSAASPAVSEGGPRLAGAGSADPQPVAEEDSDGRDRSQ